MSRVLAHQSAMKKQEQKFPMFKKMRIKKRRCVCCVSRSAVQCSAMHCWTLHVTYIHTYISSHGGQVAVFFFLFSFFFFNTAGISPDSSTCSHVADYTPIYPYIVMTVKRQINFKDSRKFNARTMSWINFPPHHHHHHHHHHHVKPL